MLKITEKFMTENDCYKEDRKIKVRGIMVHSTTTPGIMAEAWYYRWNKAIKNGGPEKAVHAFLDDKEAFQYLPWDHRGWHAGGMANNTHVGFEICEPAGIKYNEHCSAILEYDVVKNQAYFNAIWNNAIELCVLLCKQFNLNEKDIICHSEGYTKGIASNHGDVMHWFPKHGKNMNLFREEVRKALNPVVIPIPVKPILSNLKVGDLVKISSGATYYSGKVIPSWVINQNWYILEIKGDRVVIDKNEKNDNSICSPINAKYLIKVNASTVPEVISEPISISNEIHVGDKVKCKTGVKKFSNGRLMASWVPSSILYVRQIEKDGSILLVSTEPIKPEYTGRVNTSDMIKI